MAEDAGYIYKGRSLRRWSEVGWVSGNNGETLWWYTMQYLVPKINAGRK